MSDKPQRKSRSTAKPSSTSSTSNAPKTPKERAEDSQDQDTKPNTTPNPRDSQPPDTSQTPLVEMTTEADRQGDVTLRSAATGPLATEATANPPREESQADATRRWRATGVAEQVAVYRDRMREEYRANHPKAKRREAHEYAWACALAAFPPPGVEPVVEPAPEPETLEIPAPEPEPAPTIVDKSPPPDDGVAGLGELPADWGTLPANASLQAEISWVTANRLRVRDGNGVDLSRALSPAPSYSALSWLETSILFPSKFADISVKATQNQEDEAQHVRREKLAIEEVRSILKEMMED